MSRRSPRNVAVLGDLNDFQFSDTLTLLKGTELHTLIDTLPVNEQYTYVFEGNSQAIDHTLLSNHAFTSIPWHYDIVHLNSEFADNASDHEPQVTRLYLPVTATSLCTNVQQFVADAGIANSLCEKLKNAEDADLRGNQKAADNIRAAFVHEVDAQTGKTISAEAADLLKRLAGAL